MQCFILAGGFATRLWPLTEKRAKPLLPLAGKPLLSHLISQIPSDLQTTVSTNAVFAEDMERWKKSIGRTTINIRKEESRHDDGKLGALGAISEWIRHEKIQEDILLLAGDNYIRFDLQRIRNVFRGNPLLVGYDIKDTDRARHFGTMIVNEKVETKDLYTIQAFEEKPLHPQSSIVSTGCYIFPANSLPILSEYAETHPDNIGGIFEELLRQKKTIDCVITEETWADIGSFNAYMHIHRTLLAGTKNIDPSATIDQETQLVESVSMGPKTTVAKSYIENTILFGSSTIDNCVIRECIIDENCTLRGIDLTKKMIRAGTVLSREKNG